ncbi:unnamed protein product, partial [Closterium sp. NIES-53]
MPCHPFLSPPPIPSPTRLSLSPHRQSPPGTPILNLIPGPLIAVRPSRSPPRTTHFRQDRQQADAQEEEDTPQDTAQDTAALFKAKMFSYEELVAATDGFSAVNVLGEGGYGKVYRGVVREEAPDGSTVERHVAVKQLNDEGRQGFNEWLVRAQSIGKGLIG